MNRSPSECVHNCSHVREIINQKIGVMLCKLVSAPSAGRHRDRPCAERFAACDVARRVANDVDFRRGELPSVLLLCSGASESAELVSVAVIISKRAEFKKMPDAVVLKFQSRAAGYISRKKRQHHMRPCFQSFE